MLQNAADIGAAADGWHGGGTVKTHHRNRLLQAS